VSAPASPKPRWLRGGSFAVSGRPHPAIQPPAPAHPAAWPPIQPLAPGHPAARARHRASQSTIEPLALGYRAPAVPL